MVARTVWRVPRRKDPLLAQIVSFDGFDPLDAIAPYEVLWAGGMFTNGALRVELASAEGPREVVGGPGGLVLRATAQLDPECADVIVVPGAAGRVTSEDPDDEGDTVPSLLAQTTGTALPALLQRALERPQTTVASVCGGSLVLAMSGLIDGRPAVTHHLGMDLLSATGTVPIEARIVDDGDLVTAAGVTSGLDLGVYLLERLLGPRIAIAVEQLFAYERRGTVWQNCGPEPVAL
jgi:transcriptional regulator GlxA family with amidase domain